ncbi:hypothetical protein [Pseudosulfitobacter sp. SM2401]|uniref:hypothetical protein n=1 Tax=Pseudosulfitobacter sp. SM2401 TaxID=3350098 RepID=UPI002A2C7801|nr:hypothetical protein [Ascidiaceihabitans sp.]
MKRFILTLSLVATPAFADVTSPSGKTIDCYCTDRSGSRIELGETICLQVDGRMFMAQCQMSLNVPMWREVQTGCLSSSVQPARQLPQSRAIDPEIATPKT